MSTSDSSSSKLRVLLHQSLDRREVLRSAGLLGVALALPNVLTGCKTPAGPASQLRNDPVAVDAWLRAIDPIQPAVLPATEFLGDLPSPGHRYTRNAATPVTTSPTMTVDVAIIGGGMAGLACAYLLKDKKPVLLEIAPNFGGNSRGESWEGIEYALGAAYLVKPEADDPIMTQFYKPLGIDQAWRASSEGSVELKGKLYAEFWEGSTTTDPAAKAQIKKVHDYFKSVAEGTFPDIPPADPENVPQSLKTLDAQSFLANVTAAAGGPLTPHVRALLEHYCWSSLGGSMTELSAAAGLNFYAGELDGVCALPGGNAQVARRLLKGIVDGGVPQANILANTAVRKVTTEGGKLHLQCKGPGETEYIIAASKVIVACPKFIAAHIVDEMPEAQSEAIASLSWRSYLVGNILLDQKIEKDQFDIYLLGKEDENFDDAEAAAANQKITDVILGQWAGGGHAQKSVLSLYRGFPYDGMRSKLLNAAAYNKYKGEFMAQIPAIMTALGIPGTADPARLRMARWGHPVVLAATGLIANGTVQKASAPIGDRIFFCNQDNWALPAIETCLTTALHITTKVRQALG